MSLNDTFAIGHNMYLIIGDLLNLDYGERKAIVVHQINGVGAGAPEPVGAGSKLYFGLTKFMSNKWPWADPYKHRKGRENDKKVAINPDSPGTIVEFTPPKDDSEAPKLVRVIGMVAQNLWHLPNDRTKEFPDDPALRQGWFKDCLFLIEQNLDVLKKENPDLEYICFPYQIACGAGGGDWEGAYLPMLIDFAYRIKSKDIKMVMVKFA